MDRKYPPVVLVKTWLELLSSSECGEVKRRASDMLVNAFGDIQSAYVFAVENGLLAEKNTDSQKCG